MFVRCSGEPGGRQARSVVYVVLDYVIGEGSYMRATHNGLAVDASTKLNEDARTSRNKIPINNTSNTISSA